MLRGDAKRSGAGTERRRRRGGDKTVTRNKGAFGLPFFLLKLETSPETSSEGFLRVLHRVCRVFHKNVIRTDIPIPLSRHP